MFKNKYLNRNTLYTMKKCKSCNKQKHTIETKQTPKQLYKNKIVSVFNKKEKTSSKKTTL